MSKYKTNFGKEYSKPCVCHACQEGLTYRDKYFGMVVCSICGNKRCPKASDHNLRCSGSNDPGQEGSVY